MKAEIDVLIKSRLDSSKLALWHKKIGDEDAKQILEYARGDGDADLRTIDLCYNDIGSEGARHIAAFIAENRNITYFNVGYNKFSKSDKDLFGKALEKNIKIRNHNITTYSDPDDHENIIKQVKCNQEIYKAYCDAQTMKKNQVFSRFLPLLALCSLGDGSKFKLLNDIVSIMVNKLMVVSAADGVLKNLSEGARNKIIACSGQEHLTAENPDILALMEKQFSFLSDVRKDVKTTPAETGKFPKLAALVKKNAENCSQQAKVQLQTSNSIAATDTKNSEILPGKNVSDISEDARAFYVGTFNAFELMPLAHRIIERYNSKIKMQSDVSGRAASTDDKNAIILPGKTNGYKELINNREAVQSRESRVMDSEKRRARVLERVV